jgi:hypothetical protein
MKLYQKSFSLIDCITNISLCKFSILCVYKCFLQIIFKSEWKKTPISLKLIKDKLIDKAHKSFLGKTGRRSPPSDLAYIKRMLAEVISYNRYELENFVGPTV